MAAYISDVYFNKEEENLETFKETHSIFNYDKMVKYHKFMKMKKIMRILIKYYKKTILISTDYYFKTLNILINNLVNIISKYTTDNNEFEYKVAKNLLEIFELKHIIRNLDEGNHNQFDKNKILHYEIGKFFFLNPDITKRVFRLVNENLSNQNILESLTEEEISAIDKNVQEEIYYIFEYFYNNELNKSSDEGFKSLCKLKNVDDPKEVLKLSNTIKLVITKNLLVKHIQTNLFSSENKDNKEIAEYNKTKKEINDLINKKNEFECTAYFGRYIYIFRNVIVEINNNLGAEDKNLPDVIKFNKRGETFSSYITSYNYQENPEQFKENTDIILKDKNNTIFFKKITVIVLKNLKYLYSEDNVNTNIILFGLLNYLRDRKGEINMNIFINNLYGLKSFEELKSKDPSKMTELLALMYYFVMNHEHISNIIFELYHEFDYLREGHEDFKSAKDKNDRHKNKIKTYLKIPNEILDKYHINYFAYIFLDQFEGYLYEKVLGKTIQEKVHEYASAKNICKMIEENNYLDLDVKVTLPDELFKNYESNFKSSVNFAPKDQIENKLEHNLKTNLLSLFLKYESTNPALKKCFIKQEVVEFDEEEENYFDESTALEHPMDEIVKIHMDNTPIADKELQIIETKVKTEERITEEQLINLENTEIKTEVTESEGYDENFETTEGE